MEIVGAIASVITLVALSKEVISIANELLQGFQSAPKEVTRIVEHVSLIVLKLECLSLVQHDSTLEAWLTEEESRILQQSLTVVKSNLLAIKSDCEKHVGPHSRLTTRLSWAFFDSKVVNGVLEQLHKVESHLVFILQILNAYVCHLSANMLTLTLWQAKQSSSTSRER